MLPERKTTPTLCKREECLHHRISPTDANRYLCAHPHKANYADSGSCPLFKLDWQKKLQQIQKAKK